MDDRVARRHLLQDVAGIAISIFALRQNLLLGLVIAAALTATIRALGQHGRMRP